MAAASKTDHHLIAGRLEIGKFSLYYETAGSGPALIFLHGLGGNHLSWWQQVPYFMRWYTCVTVDQRSFGMSPDPDGLFNSAHASDLARLLDHLRLDKAVLVGQSMGGWTIVGCAIEHRDRIAGMVMADTPGGIFTPEMKFPQSRPTLMGAAPAIGKLPTYAGDFFLRNRELAFLYDSLMILGARPPADAMQRLGAAHYDLARAKAALTMPILCVAGEDDALIPAAMIETLAAWLPDGRFASVPHCGHSIYFEQAAVFNQLVRDFLIDIKYGK
ncbi:MAG: alpha/beta fold hydrolase [Candidatus Binataceae bacterium]